MILRGWNGGGTLATVAAAWPRCKGVVSGFRFWTWFGIGKEIRMKYVVLGAAGQLGRDLCPRLAGEIVPLTRHHADLNRPEKLKETLAALRPSVVINCAAYNFVDKAESEPEAAF